MSASSSSINQGQGRNIENTKCGCGYERYERTAWTVDQPGRRFWNCPFSLMTGVNKCRYFLWKDREMLDPYYKELIFQLKQDVDQLVDQLESGTVIRQYRRRIQELVNMAKELEKQAAEETKVAQGEKSILEMEVLKFSSANARLAKLIEYYKSVLTILVVGLGVTAWMIWFG